MTLVDELQRQAFDAMTPAERFQYSTQMFEWAWGVVERQVRAELGELPPEAIKYHVALRFYGCEPEVRKLIEEQLARVSPGSL
jgi:hypothetical protein